MDANNFIRWLQTEKNYSEHTIAAYRNDIGQLSDYALESFSVSISQVNLSIARSWTSSLLESGLSASSVRRKIVAVSRFFDFLIKESVLSSNPFERVSRPKSPKRLVKTIPEEDLAMLFSEEPAEEEFSVMRDVCVLKTLYTLGLRKSELINLSLEHIDWRRKELKVQGKGSKERMLPVPENLMGDLSRYDSLRQEQLDGIGLLDNEQAFFVTDSGRSLYPTFVSRLTHRALSTLSNVSKSNPHILRHSFATHLLSSGANLKAIQDLLGHSSLASTEVYTHNSIEQLKQVYKGTHPKS